MNGTVNDNSPARKNYNKADGRHGWGQRIAELLRRVGKPLTANQIIDLLSSECELEPKITNKHIYFSTQIFHACKREWIKLQYSARKRGFYCLPEWYDENGNLPEEAYIVMNRL